MLASGSFSTREARRILGHVSALLAEVDGVQARLPLSLDAGSGTHFCEAAQDGILICELIEKLVPGTMKLGKVHRDLSSPKRRPFLMLENQAMALAAAQRIGCRLVNVGAADLVDGKAYLVLGVLWQIIKCGVIAKVQQSASQASGAPEADSDDVLRGLLETHIAEPEADDVSVMLRLMREAGLPAGYLDEIEAAAGDEKKRAELIVLAGRHLLLDLCMLDARDILSSNREMVNIFIASLLDLVLRGRPGAAQAEPDSALVAQYREQAKRLADENEYLGDKLVSLQAELERLRAADGAEQEPGGRAGANSDLADGLLRDVTRRLPEIHDRHGRRLRQIYQSTTRIGPLAESIYGDLSFKTISEGAAHCGVLTRKERGSLKWRARLMVLRDNFLFAYAAGATPRDLPVDVCRVDDALIRVMFEVQHMEDPVISVEISSRVDPSYLYLSAPAIHLNTWKEAIAKASAWWFTAD